MTTTLVQINPAEFGLEESKAQQISDMFQPMLDKMVELEAEYNEIVGQEVKASTCFAAKALRLKYVKIRTGTAAIHKELKAFYLNGGRFVDGWKNTQLMASQGIETRLADIENYFENIEKIRIHKLEEDRRLSLLPFMNLEYMPPSLGEMETFAWDNFLNETELQYKLKAEAERKAEEDRIAKEQAEREELERVMGENELLRKHQNELKDIMAEEQKARRQAEANERQAQAKAERIEREQTDREEAERAATVAAEQTELAKGDGEKMTDFRIDIQRIMEKYHFDSEAYQVTFQRLAFIIDNAIKQLDIFEANL